MPNDGSSRFTLGFVQDLPYYVTRTKGADGFDARGKFATPERQRGIHRIQVIPATSLPLDRQLTHGNEPTVHFAVAPGRVWKGARNDKSSTRQCRGALMRARKCKTTPTVTKRKLRHDPQLEPATHESARKNRRTRAFKQSAKHTARRRLEQREKGSPGRANSKFWNPRRPHVIQAVSRLRRSQVEA